MIDVYVLLFVSGFHSEHILDADILCNVHCGKHSSDVSAATCNSTYLS